MRIHKAAVLILGFGLAAGKCCFAAPQTETASNCSTAYENHNQIEIRPLKTHLIQGTSQIDVGAETQPVIAGACFALFSDKDHSLVASVQAGSDGHFEFKAVPPGRYRLVARAKGLCTANILLEVVKSSAAKARIVVHFRASGIDTCSYGELAWTHESGNPIYEYDALFACVMR
jgi:hypothetical protein